MVTAYGVTIKNSKVGCVIDRRVPPPTPRTRRLTIQDTEIVCPIGAWNTGIRFSNFTAIRVNIHDCENGLDIGNHVTLRDSYIHDLATGPTHTDGIQSGDGSTRRSSTTRSTVSIHRRSTSTTTQAVPTTHNVLIKDNLLAGGGWTLYCPSPATTTSRSSTTSFSTNFSPKVGQFGPATDCAGEIQSGNVYHETGAPLNLG